MDGGIIRRLIAVALVAAAATALAGVFDSYAGAAPTARSLNCGEAAVIPATNGGYWHCSFSDEFDGSSLDRTKWIPQSTATSLVTTGLIGCFQDSPNNVSVSGGTLKLTARRETTPVACDQGLIRSPYTSGQVSTYGRFSQAYGRFEVRARISPAQAQGLQTAFWLWPVDSTRYGAWPASGEIDFAEMYSKYPDRVIPYIHYNSAARDPNMTNNYCLVSNLDEFHTYAVEWTESSIKVIYDGWTCLTDHWNPRAPLTHPQPFDQPFMIALTQAFGTLGNFFLPFTPPLPATTVVDYVHVWKYGEQGTSGRPTGQRARALKKCKRLKKKRMKKKGMKKSKAALKKCKKKARRLPV